MGDGHLELAPQRWAIIWRKRGNILRFARNRIVELSAAPNTKRPCRCASRVSPRRGRFYVWAFEASPRLFWSSFTLWQSSQPGPVRFPTLQTLQVRFAHRAGNGRFRREFGDRKRAEGTNFFTYPYSSGSRCRSLLLFAASEPRRLAWVGFVGRTPRPPDTPNPKSSPSPGWYHAGGFVFRPDAGFIEDEVGAACRLPLRWIMSLRCCGITPRCNNRYMTRNYSWITL